MKIRHIPSIHKTRKRQVAAYCRVSTDKINQEDSFETQVNYYTKLIESTPEWEMVKVYADEGKSATSVSHRPGFLQMIDDAMADKIEILSGKWIQTHDCEHEPKPHEIRHLAAIA